VLLSLPSPGDPFVFQLGGLQPRWYGLLLAVAAVAAVWMTRRRFRACGLDPELVFPVAVCAVVAGFVGARIEHIATDWSPYEQIPANMLWIWRGGLGIYGGILGGMLGAALGCRIVRLPFWTVADCAAPGLPWAIRIAHPLPPYVPKTAFQPTFLYEALWDLAVLGVLVWFVRRTANRVRPGTVFALYAGLYSLGRLWVETIRIDPTDHVLGQRVDIWVAALVCVLAAAAFAVLWGRRPAV
jgi:prolipoprotein diacylglyceryltransferase